MHVSSAALTARAALTDLSLQVLRTGEYVVWDDWTYGERMIADRVSNPHGEHAHGFYSIDVSAGEEDGDE